MYLDIVSGIATQAAEALADEPTIEGQARSALRAGWVALTEDPRKARIVALEVVGVSDRLEQLRRDTRHALADITVTRALAVASDDIQLRLDPVLTSRFLIGGVVEVLVDWIHGEVDALRRRADRALHPAVHRRRLRGRGRPGPVLGGEARWSEFSMTASSRSSLPAKVTS